MLAAAEVVPRTELTDTVLLGELGLDGRARPVRGILPAMLAAVQAGFTRVVVPVRQAGEAALVEGLDVLGVGSLAQLVAFFRGDRVPEAEPVEPHAGRHAPAGGLGDYMAPELREVVLSLEGRHHQQLRRGRQGGRRPVRE